MNELASLTCVAQRLCADKSLEYVGYVASGAFKSTYHVRDKNGVSIALKICSPERTTARNEREIEALRSCDDPRVARLQEFGTYACDGKMYLFLAEEFLDGGTLGDRIEGAPMFVDAVEHLGRELSASVAHIANKGFVHRDIKPENIMFRHGSDVPVLVDFGLVRDLGAPSLTDSWSPKGPGTPLFSSPEQLTNDKAIIDWRSDQFSVGVTLYYCLSQKHPYQRDGDTEQDTIARVKAREQPGQQFESEVSAQNLGILTRMVQAWPGQRFRRPADLLENWISLPKRR